MDQTNAASWGWLRADASSGAVEWSRDRLEAARIPLSLLPKLVPSASPLGALDSQLARRWGLSAQPIVHAAVGDHPVSIYAQALEDGEMSISIGTSSQVCRVARGLIRPDAATTDAAAASSPNAAAASPAAAVEHRPFIYPLSHSSLLLCASLNGGNVLQTFVQGLERAVRELHGDDQECASKAEEPAAEVARRGHKIFAKLIRQGQAIMQEQQQQQQQHTSSSSTSASAASSAAVAAAASSVAPLPPLPLCDARFFSERCTPAARGALTGLSYPVLDARQASGGAAALFLALCRGVICNLRCMIEGGRFDAESQEGAAVSKEKPAMLRDLQSIRCVGAALQRNPLLVRFVADVFELPVERVVLSWKGDADAAQGAALLAMDWESVIAPKWAQ